MAQGLLVILRINNVPSAGSWQVVGISHATLFKEHQNMKLKDMKPNFLYLPPQERGFFVLTYRELREKDLTAIQSFNLTSDAKKTTRAKPGDKKVAVTAEGLNLLRQMGLI